MKVSQIKVASIIYCLGDSGIDFIYVGPSGRCEHITCPSARNTIRKLHSLRDEITNPLSIATGDVPQLTEFMNGYGADLLPPASLLTDVDVIVIVPHAMLHSIPFHLIHINGRPLCSQFGITYSSSISYMSRCMSRNRSRKYNLDEWIFDEFSPTHGAHRRRNAIVGGVDVQGHQNEMFKDVIDQIARHIDGSVKNFSSSHHEHWIEFSRNSFKAVFRFAEETDILCVAAHGYIDPENQRKSGLLLARDIGVILRNIPLHGGRYFDFRDLPLREYPLDIQQSMPAEVLTSAEMEIDGELHTELVVLLGCSTNVNHIFPGDEPASLAEVFLHIGASSVIASVWDVDSDFISDWATSFFDGWQNYDLPKALACRRAINQLMPKWKDRPERLGCIILKGDWL